MTQMKFSELSDFNFTQAVQKLAHVSKFNIQVAGRVAVLVKEMNTIRKDMQDLYKSEIADKFAEKDAKGNVIYSKNMDEYPEFGFKPKEGVLPEDFKKVRDEFGEHKVSIRTKPILLSMLTGADLTPAEIILLGDLIKNDVADEGEEKGPGVPHLSSVN